MGRAHSTRTVFDVVELIRDVHSGDADLLLAPSLQLPMRRILTRIVM